MKNYLTRIESFTKETLPDLDEVVMAALQFYSDIPLPRVDHMKHHRPLVIGSGNALQAGKILFSDDDAIFVDEGSYGAILNHNRAIDAVYVISASGGKHAIDIVKHATEQSLPVYLLTSNRLAPARDYMDPGHIIVYPHIREPYTYNTSTYMGMLLGEGKEEALAILEYIESYVKPCIPSDFARYDAYTLIVPPQYEIHEAMFTTKFDELFGPLCSGRSFDYEEIKHAKTVIFSETECFISFGEEQNHYGNTSTRLTIPLPETYGAVAMMAIGYFVIGHIQKQKPPYYKESIEAYVAQSSLIFGQEINSIVE